MLSCEVYKAIVHETKSSLHVDVTFEMETNTQPRLEATVHI